MSYDRAAAAFPPLDAPIDVAWAEPIRATLTVDSGEVSPKAQEAIALLEQALRDKDDTIQSLMQERNALREHNDVQAERVTVLEAQIDQLIGIFA